MNPLLTMLALVRGNNSVPLEGLPPALMRASNVKESLRAPGALVVNVGAEANSLFSVG